MKTQNTTHTPGPWKLAPDAEGRGSWAIWDSMNRKVGATRPLADYDKRPGSPMRADHNEANANLIAAAPELLAALVNLAGEMEDFDQAAGGEHAWQVRQCDHDKENCPVCAARAAIAKAKGQP